jgi:hypothetical protein
MQNTAYDALSEREDLATRLAAWKAAEFIPTDLASRWHRRMRRLARMTGLTVAQVMANLNEDADAILAADDE